MEKTLFIPEGLVYGRHSPMNHFMGYHLVLEGNYPHYNKNNYYEDILSINSNGTLMLVNSNVEHSVEIFLTALKRERIFFLSDYLFDHFKDFFRVSDFKKSKRYGDYPKVNKLCQKTPELEKLISSFSHK